MKESIRMILTLVIICILSAITLSITYDKTNPIIQENKVRALKEALKEVLNADHFEEIDFQTDKVKKIFKGLDNNNEVIGFVLLSEKAGFQSFIKTLIGVELKTRKITKIKIIEHLETPGLGARIEEDTFLSQFQNQELEKQNVDAITGATISSTAVIESVKDSLEEILDLIKEGKIEGVTLEENVD